MVERRKSRAARALPSLKNSQGEHTLSHIETNHFEPSRQALHGKPRTPPVATDAKDPPRLPQAPNSGAKPRATLYAMATAWAG